MAPPQTLVFDISRSETSSSTSAKAAQVGWRPTRRAREGGRGKVKRDEVECEHALLAYGFYFTGLQDW